MDGAVVVVDADILVNDDVLVFIGFVTVATVAVTSITSIFMKLFQVAQRKFYFITKIQNVYYVEIPEIAELSQIHSDK